MTEPFYLTEGKGYWPDEVDGMKQTPPKALEQIADVVLNYRPKSKQPKPRKRKKARKRNVR
jgi:hypothetical protein